MAQFLTYRFILSFIVYILLTGIFTVGLVVLVRLTNKVIRAGLNDEKIKLEYQKEQAHKASLAGKIVDKVVLILSCAVMFVAFGFSLAVTLGEGKPVGPVPSMSVVQSDSMSKIHENHKYLDEGEVTDQIQMFDLIFVNQLPSESELKVNDIVVYEVDGISVIHRIVAIEEPSLKHPDERQFLLQGDANNISDRFPVLYKQMRGIYGGSRIPFIGSFVMFMQSPAGYLCVILVLVAIIATPIAEKKTKKEKYLRLVAMGLIDGDGKAIPEEIDPIKNFGSYVPKRQPANSPYVRGVMVRPIIMQNSSNVIERIIERPVYVPVSVNVVQNPTCNSCAKVTVSKASTEKKDVK